MHGLTVIIEATIRPGKKDELERTIAELVVDVKENEPGILDYGAFIADDRMKFLEGYEDSAAFVNHAGRAPVQAALGTIMANVDVKRVTCLGEPTAEAKAVLDGFGAAYFAPAAGFKRTTVVT